MIADSRSRGRFGSPVILDERLVDRWLRGAPGPLRDD